MVAPGRGAVRVEIVPWLTQHFGRHGSSRLVLEEDIAGGMTLGDFLASLAEKHPAIGTTIVDFAAGELYEHVSVVHNDTLLGAPDALAARIEPGDCLVFLPAFSGG